MATANVKGVQITGTPQEIKEFYNVMNNKDKNEERDKIRELRKINEHLKNECSNKGISVITEEKYFE